MTTGISHYLLQWWNHRVEGTLPLLVSSHISVQTCGRCSVGNKLSLTPLPKQTTKTPPLTTTKPNEMTDYRVKGEALPMLTTLEADFFLSLPPSKIMFGCDPS